MRIHKLHTKVCILETFWKSLQINFLKHILRVDRVNTSIWVGAELTIHKIISGKFRGTIRLNM